MIKINLLGAPTAKKVRKASQAQSQIILGGIILLVSLLVTLYGWHWLNNKIALLNEEKGKKDKELVALKEKVKEVENLESVKKALEEKVKIIDQLKKNQSGPVHLLDELSKSLPDRVWLISFTEQNGSVDLDGKAMSNAELVAFVWNLSHTPLFSNVQLIESRSANEGNTEVFSFKMKFQYKPAV
ncbi:MAG: PilN domain-containing protein [Nitrospirae bacterium]|nr:PilN domain-containing protein [Nitrospirota bacterium]